MHPSNRFKNYWYMSNFIPSISLWLVSIVDHVCVCVCVCLIAQSCLILSSTMDRSQPGFSVVGVIPAQYWNGLQFPPPGGLPNPETEHKSSASLHCSWILYSWATGEAPPPIDYSKVNTRHKIGFPVILKWVYLQRDWKCNLIFFCVVAWIIRFLRVL